jgi:hypothetical protein
VADSFAIRYKRLKGKKRKAAVSKFGVSAKVGTSFVEEKKKDVVEERMWADVVSCGKRVYEGFRRSHTRLPFLLFFFSQVFSFTFSPFLSVPFLLVSAFYTVFVLVRPSEVLMFSFRSL